MCGNAVTEQIPLIVCCKSRNKNKFLKKIRNCTFIFLHVQLNYIFSHILKEMCDKCVLKSTFLLLLVSFLWLVWSFSILQTSTTKYLTTIHALLQRSWNMTINIILYTVKRIFYCDISMWKYILLLNLDYTTICRCLVTQ